MSDFSPAVVIVHPSGSNNVGYEQAFPLWVTGSTSSVVQMVSGSVTAVLTGTVNVAVQSMPNITGSVNVTNSLFNVTGSVAVNNIVTVTGSVGTSITNFPSTQTITGSVIITSTGSLPVLLKQSQTSFSSSLPGSITSQVLLSASNNRIFASVYNDSTSKLYLLLGTGASSTVFTLRMDGQTYYEVPIQYTGPVTGVWSSGVGDARMTEIRQ